MRRVVAVCSWLYLVVALGLWALLRAADLWWPATFLLFSPRWLLVLPLALLLPAAALLRPRALGPLLVGLVLVGGPVMGFCIPWRLLVPNTPAATRVRVLTCNMHYRNPDPAPLGRLLAETRPDIVVLQEWGGPDRSPLFTEGDWHVHRAPRLFLASRYPVLRAQDSGRHSTDEKGVVARYELETLAGIVTFFSLHFSSPREGLREVVHEWWNGAAELEAGTARRWEQSESLAGEAGAVSGPVLLAGDFNTPPASAIFRRTWAGYTDAFSAAGWGLGYTFIGGKTTVRIDHILAGPGWRCERCWVGPDVGSPHRPVLADLTWPLGK